jgi:hypothetical protein
LSLQVHHPQLRSVCAVSEQRISALRHTDTTEAAMGEEVEKHILRKYELLQKLGKGVRCG